jgi:hypothetical protein
VEADLEEGKQGETRHNQKHILDNVLKGTRVIGMNIENTVLGKGTFEMLLLKFRDRCQPRGLHQGSLVRRRGAGLPLSPREGGVLGVVVCLPRSPLE